MEQMVLCLFFYGFRLWSFFFISAWNRPLEIAVALLMWFRYDRKTVPVGRSFSQKKRPPKNWSIYFFFNKKKITNEFLPSPLIRNLVAFEKTIPVVPFRWKNRGTPDGVTTHQFGKPGHQLGNRFSERLFSLVAFLGSSSNDAPG